ncbi:hypothetical protein EDB89DRAFT_1962438 [Lactarius sanguifluus]|nr:hypothetical protein EDB89DRAFT_1962438 [Lactarius sanguifluus]
MSLRTVDPSQRLRIAIGLTALKFKPPEQSIQSYTLELKHHFRHSAPWSGSSEECDAWRDRVVALEAELQTTRAAASSEHIELLALKSISAQKSQVPEPTTSASKKKGKPPKKPRRTSDPKKAHVLGVCLPSKRKTPEPCAGRTFSVLFRCCRLLYAHRGRAIKSSSAADKPRSLLLATRSRCCCFRGHHDHCELPSGRSPSRSGYDPMHRRPAWPACARDFFFASTRYASGPNAP